MSDLTKQCPACVNELPLDRFDNYRAAKDGKQPWCRACQAEYRKRRVAKTDSYYSDAEQAARTARPRGPQRRNIRYKYGLSADNFDSLVIEHGGRCGICSAQLVKLNVDHDHATGRIRGLLCSLCNRALGFFRDSPDRLRSAANYLENDPAEEAFFVPTKKLAKTAI